MAKTSYATLFDTALEAGARRDYAEAETTLTRIVAETDAMPEAWLYLGRARYALGDYGRAIPAFSTFLGYDPESAAGWFFLGRGYLAIGRNRAAAYSLQRAIDKGRAGADAWALLGFAELRQKRSAKAVACLERAISLAPNDHRVYRAYLNALYVHAIRSLARGQAAEAASMLGFVIDNGLDGPAQRLYRSRALRASGDVPSAVAELELAVRAEPDDPSLRLQLAALRFSAGDPDGAMAEIERSGVSLPEQRGAPWTADAVERWRVIVALRDGDYRTALKAALERIRRGDADAAIRAVAAQANMELGRYDRAAAHYQRAVEADPGAPDLRIGLALAKYELGDYQAARAAARSATARGAARDDSLYVELLCDVKTGVDPRASLPTAQALLRARPGDPRLMMALAECLYKTGEAALADGWFADVLRLWPSHELAMLYRVSVAESLGNDDDALERYGEYLASFPDNAAVRRDYIDALVAAESWDRAATAIEEGKAYGAIHGSDGILAMCYRYSGRYREAAALYRSMLKSDPKNVELLLGLSYSLYRSGAKSAAIELLERGGAFIGRSAEPYLALGVLRARQNDSEKAAAAFLRASELAPADPRPLRNLAKLYAKAGVQSTADHFNERAEAIETGGKPRKKR